MDNVCIKCDKPYENTYKYCPVHGDMLTNFTPPDRKLDVKSLDLFKRSVCPHCDAWNNWDINQDIYTCKTCNVAYRYSGGQLFYALNDATLTNLLDEKGKKETTPAYIILTKIDEKNKAYWLNIFKTFEIGRASKKWNWPSFFFDVFWYFWKGIWKNGLMYLGVTFAILFLLDALEAPSWLFFVVQLPLKIYIGYTGSKDYYKFVNKFGTDETRARKEFSIGRWLFAGYVILHVISSIIERTSK